MELEVKDNDFIALIANTCKEYNLIPIVILKTPLAGETVDNGMGVDFELMEYALIYKKTKNTNIRDTDVFFEEPFNEKLKTFDLENLMSLEGMIENLNSMDEYVVIWKNEEYAPRKPLESKLEEHGNSLTIVFKKTYSLFISNEEMDRYIEDISRDHVSLDSLLIDALTEREDFDKIFGNRYFPRDMIKNIEARKVKGGIEFVFGSDAKETLYDFKDTPTTPAETRDQMLAHLKTKFKDKNLLNGKYE